MRYLKAIYVDGIEVKAPDGETVTLDVWMNPETKKLVAIDNMQVYLPNNFINDPYEEGIRLVFEDTFTGLPK